MWAALASTLLLILLATVWDLATDQAEQRVHAEQSAQSHIQYAEDRIDQECLSLEPEALRDCIHKEIESARDHDRSNQDLGAQQQMAFFTKIMAWTTAAGLVLGVVSIAVIYATLSEMGRTNQIMLDERRPWLVLNRDFECEFQDIGHGGILTWNYDVENKGRGPAYDVTVNYTLIKRRHLQHMPDQLAQYLEHVMSNRRINQHRRIAVIFPEESTETVKYYESGSIRYQRDQFSMMSESREGHTMAMVCVTYRLYQGSDRFGYDVRMLGVTDNSGRIGPWRHELLEFGGVRLVG